MPRKVALLIDGGHLRALARVANRTYDPTLIEKMAHHCAEPDEELFRILYYDCAQYVGTQNQPVTLTPREFKGSDAWLRILAEKNLFAVRRGVLKFRGWEPKVLPVGQAPTDSDFEPRFEQKGVDMRIGLDIASLSAGRVVERILLVTGDTDFVPALKHARRAGLQVALIDLPGHKLSTELVTHADFRRTRAWK